jgi:hypothetical protein
MLWNRLRQVTVLVLAVGIVSGGTNAYVRGFQQPTSGGEKAAPKPAAGGTTPPSQPGGAKGQAGKPEPADPRRQLRAQQLATRKARAAYQIARLNRELAELAIEEYEELGFPRELAMVEAEVSIAKSDAARSADHVEWARKMFDKGYVSQATRDSEELSLKKLRLALELAQSKRQVLVDYTKNKTTKELRAAVEKARIDELEKQDASEREELKQTELEYRLRRGAN